MSQLNLEDVCKRLQDSDRYKQALALKELGSLCEDSAVTSTSLMSVFDECYLHLLKCYSARYESVREAAVETVMKFLKRLPPNDFHLLNVVSTLKERMGQQETVEECETIRHLYIIQLNILVCLYKDTGRSYGLHQCYADITQILVKALRDLYPVVQCEATTCIVNLVESADSPGFTESAGVLAKSVYGMLNHKHSKSRIFAIRTLGPLALHVNASGEDLSRLLMEVSPLLMDSMPLVRRECGDLGVFLLLNLRDRYSYFDRIIPLVLCCLKDDSLEVIDYIRPLWKKCGKQFYEENEVELSKQDLADKKPINYPLGVERPTIGCRGLVQRSLRLLKLIVREASDWKENVRLHSMKLLYQFVLHAEAAMTAKFFEIYRDVACACRDSDSSVVGEALKVADLMGRLFSYSDWCEHGFEGLEKNPTEGYLKCFYFLFASAIGPKFKDLLRVTQILIVPEISESFKTVFQTYVIMMMENLLDKLKFIKEDLDDVDNDGEDDVRQEEFDRNIYIITMKVMALGYESAKACNEKIEERGGCILEKIAERRNISCDQLHEKYFAYVLDHVKDLDASLDALCEPIILLHGLIRIAKFRADYLPQIEEKINEVWQNGADDAKLKVFSSISIAMLKWHESMNKPVDIGAKLLEQFLVNVVEQHIIWRAGATAEALRSLATATLCSMSQGATEEAKIVFRRFAKYFPNLLEDREASTRNYALRCLQNFAELSVEDLKPVAYCLLSRLDDPSSEVRNLAAIAIPHLIPKYNDEEENEAAFDKEIWTAFIKRAFDMLFLHYDGPEIRLRKPIKDSLKKLADIYPTAYKESFEKALMECYPGSGLLLLKAELGFK